MRADNSLIGRKKHLSHRCNASLLQSIQQLDATCYLIAKVVRQLHIEGALDEEAFQNSIKGEYLSGLQINDHRSDALMFFLRTIETMKYFEEPVDSLA